MLQQPGSVKNSVLPTPDLFPGGIYCLLYDHFDLSWCLATRRISIPGSPYFCVAQTPHGRLSLSSEELLKAGQHEDRPLDFRWSLCVRLHLQSLRIFRTRTCCKNALHTVAFVAEPCSLDLKSNWNWVFIIIIFILNIIMKYIIVNDLFIYYDGLIYKS